MTTFCVYPSCHDIGVVEGEATAPDGSEIRGWLCFPHWTPAPAAGDTSGNPTGGTEVETTGGAQLPPTASLDDLSFSVEVVAGLAAMLMEHTAMALRPEDGAITEAVKLLAGNTLLADDVCTGILLALTWIAAAGDVTDEMLTAGAEQYEQLVEAEAEQQGPGSVAAGAEILGDSDRPLRPEEDPSDTYRPAVDRAVLVATLLDHAADDIDRVRVACDACDDNEHDECEDPREMTGPMPSSADGLPTVVACCCGALDLGVEVEAEEGAVCEWFALCSRPATHDEDHPILGHVPACDECPAVGR